MGMHSPRSFWLLVALAAVICGPAAAGTQSSTAVETPDSAQGDRVAQGDFDGGLAATPPAPFAASFAAGMRPYRSSDLNDPHGPDGPPDAPEVVAITCERVTAYVARSHVALQRCNVTAADWNPDALPPTAFVATARGLHVGDAERLASCGENSNHCAVELRAFTAGEPMFPSALAPAKTVENEVGFDCTDELRLEDEAGSAPLWCRHQHCEPGVNAVGPASGFSICLAAYGIARASGATYHGAYGYELENAR